MGRFPSRERAAAVALEPRVSAVVVVHTPPSDRSARSALELCLNSAMAEPWIDELIVVDLDNDPDVSSSLRALQLDRRDVKVVAAPAGATLAAASNLGAAKARGRWLLFLDADVVLQRGAVARMAAAGGEADAPWIVGGRLMDVHGRERPAARSGKLNAWSALAVAMDWRGPRPLRRRNARSAPAEPARVAAVSGALMLMPRRDFADLDGFEESFVANGADLDLCRRAADAGGSVLFQPAATGVQVARMRPRVQAQGLALFAARSAKTPLQQAFAFIARPAILCLVWLKDFVLGRPPTPR